MKERPILFSAPMVSAILAGAKSQTRRVVKWPAWLLADDYDNAALELRSSPEIALMQDGRPMRRFRCPYGQPGDRLWVRETWAVPHRYDGHGPSNIPTLDVRVHYAASEDRGGLRWRPSIHMCRWASRITLEVTGVRVERLQEISDEDAKAEGVADLGERLLGVTPHRARFFNLWESINGPGSWDANPWVWVIEFDRPTA